MVYYPGIAASAFIVPTSTMPLFVAAGAGSGSDVSATDLTPGSPTGGPLTLTDGDWLIAQVVVRGTGTVGTLTCATPASWNLWYEDITTQSPHCKQFIFAREWNGVFAMPAFNWDAAAPTTLPAARSRIYAVRGTAGAREGAALSTGAVDGTIEIPSVTTTGSNRFVMALATTTRAELPDAPGHAAGETGGDYTAPVTGFSAGGGNCMIVIQTAPMVSAGLISGGVITLPTGSPQWLCRAFALLPT